MSAQRYTREFAREGGYTGDSQAMLTMFEAIRQNGIRYARQAHFERVKVVEQFKAEPGMFFAVIKPSLSTQEAIEDARRIRFSYRNLPTWQKEYRRPQMQKAALTEIYARFFRRYGRRIWISEAA